MKSSSPARRQIDQRIWIPLFVPGLLAAGGLAALLGWTARPAAVQAAGGLLPPATFYGLVQANEVFTPSLNLPVEAWIQNTLCAAGQTSAAGQPGSIVFVLDVPSDGQTPNCGVPDRQVDFRVGGRWMAQTALWNNAAPIALNLSARENRVYLPQIQRAYLPPAPDLVGSFSLSPAQPAAGQPVEITAIISNTGTQAAGNFWVDFYIQPNPAPGGPNLTWDTRCPASPMPCYGISWYVSQTLNPGQNLTLLSRADNYDLTYTRWPGAFAAGTRDLYLYVDSWSDVGAPNGAVAESDEANNRTELHLFTPLAAP